MADPKITRNPSPYPPPPFHILRLCQFISAAVVTIVVWYFVYFLLHEHYKLPWTFIFLLTASSLTILALFLSSALYHFRTLPPKSNLTSNAALAIFWTIALGFLTSNVGWTIGHRCAIETWHTEAGITVCRLYKACTAFTVTSLLSTLLALSLDVHIHRKSSLRGQYNKMHEIDAKRSIPIISRPTPQYEPFSSQRAEQETGDLGEQRPYKVQESIEVQHFGYSAPAEQTKYDPVREMD